MQDRFIGRNQGIPVFDDQLLPVFGAIAVSSDVLVEEMGIGNNPGILVMVSVLSGVILLEIYLILVFLIKELVEQPVRRSP